MDVSKLSVREIRISDVEHIVRYWMNLEDESLLAMGADPKKIYSADQFRMSLHRQISSPYREKKALAVIWLIDDEPSGHCNVNNVKFGDYAYMHLHMWQSSKRRLGMGKRFVEMSIPIFFEKLSLKTIYCEPYALNEAPNKTLEKIGFQFEKEYVTTPGNINFEQPVKKWKLKKTDI